MTDNHVKAGAGERWSLERPFRREGQVGWVADLPAELHALTDTSEKPYRSRLRLFEEQQALGPPHSSHETIRRQGRGCYSFWGNVVYFSTTDGSDPNHNERAYDVTLPPLLEEPRVEVATDGQPPQWRRPDRPLRCAIFGLGNRGLGLGVLARGFSGVEIAWVVDQSERRITQARELFCADVRGTTDARLALADPSVDIAIVTVPDNIHRSIAEPAFLAGKHVFVEKPLATNAGDAKAILETWRRSGRILQLGYVLRQAPFYRAIRSVLRQGILGQIRVASLSEQLEVRHGASFMRRWHSDSRQSGGLIVHKGCHDLDILCWLLDTWPREVSSFGGLNTFRGPPPAPFCSQCRLRSTCPYTDTGLHERRTEAERADPSAYGLDRCVFRDDKDIIDNQVVSFALNNGTLGTFVLAMQGPVRSERRITLIGDRARLDGIFEEGHFSVTFIDPARKPLDWRVGERGRGGHGGGDRVTMLDFLDACAGRAPPPVIDTQDALRGLIFALAAERSRLEGIVLKLDEGALPP